MESEKINKIQVNLKEFFRSGITRKITFRIANLLKLRQIIFDNERLILKALKDDLNKSEIEAYSSEIGIVIKEIDYALKHIEKWSRPQKVKTPLINKPGRSYFIYEPYGTALIISPWNYPFGLFFLPLVGAIAAGNCMLLKPSEIAQNTSALIAKLLNENFSENYLRVIEGDAKVTQELINPLTDYIFFTGSTEVGKIIMKKAAEYLIPITLELGGKNPCIVDKDADLEISAKRIAWGKFFNSGQTCIAPDYLLLHKDIKNQFISIFKQTITKFYGENLLENKNLAKVINEKHFNRLIKLLSEGKIEIGGQHSREKPFIAPTLISEINENSEILKNEIFGPILPVLSFDNLDDEILKILAKPKPLAIYYFSKNKSKQEKIINSTSSGGVCINGTINFIMSNDLPFGGVGQSGFGKYHGKASFETFSHKKAILKKSFHLDQKYMYPPNKLSFNIFKKAVKFLY